MASVEALQAELAALKNEVARLSTHSEDRATPIQASEPPIAVPPASTNVRLPSAVGVIPRVVDNQVPRYANAPKTASLLDLRMDRGFVAVSQGGSAAMQHEYRWSASAFSYLKDGVAELERIIPALQDEAKRKGFTVVRVQLGSVLSLMEKRLDFLKLFGEHRSSEPGLVQAVENAIAGTADLPVTSSTVLDAVVSYRDKKTTTAIKQGASMDYSMSGQGRDSGHGRRGRQGQQQQQQQGGRHPYNTRQSQAADGAAGEH
jgi:uncharacterized small protein (DUF1192 family)